VLYDARENRLREHKNSVLRRKFGPKRENVMRYWSKLPNEEGSQFIVFIKCYYSGETD
jgi:hypothetical protein